MRLILLACASPWLCGAAVSQVDDANTTLYEPVFFERFVPQNALDMVERVPGFALDSGENRRGLAGAAGNVLIDGREPVAKGQSLRGILRRIPASTVERLELIRGTGTSASNAQAVRVNVVRKSSGGSGTWRTTLDYTEDGRITPSADATWTGRLGPAEYRVSADARLNHSPGSGTEAFFDSDGTLEEQAFEVRNSDDQRLGASGEVAILVPRGQFAVAGTVDHDTGQTGDIATIRSALGDTEAFERLNSEQVGTAGELSATLFQRHGNWETEVSALWVAESSDNTQRGVDLGATGQVTDATLEETDTKESEIVLRLAASRGLGTGLVSLQGEVAYNTLEQTLDLFEEIDGALEPVDLPGADTLVDEVRFEAGVTRGFDFAQVWAVEAGVSVEHSRLTNRGDTPSERDLTFWKPSLQLTRRLGDNDQLRIRVFRDVDQLDFQDFAAGVQLDNETILAGNTELRPEASWRAEVSGDWRFDKGALTVTLYGSQIEDVQDFALFETETDRFDTLGNIGDGRVYGVSSRLETPLVWIPAAQITVDATLQASEVTDPLTGETRERSGEQTQALAIELRQDLEAYAVAWGVELDYEEQAPQFRFDRLSQNQEQSRVRLWLETTAFGNFKTTLRIDDLFGRAQTRERERFYPDRRGALDRFDRRTRDTGPTVSLRLEGAF